MHLYSRDVGEREAIPGTLAYAVPDASSPIAL